MINSLRWLVALPLGMAASFATHLISGFIFGIAHGFEDVSKFWESNDMAGMPFSGTYMILVTRTLAAFSLIGTVAWIVPKWKKQTAITLAFLLSGLTLTVVAFFLYQNIISDFQMGFGGWYRTILESASLIMGCILGIGLSSSPEYPNNHSE